MAISRNSMLWIVAAACVLAGGGGVLAADGIVIGQAKPGNIFSTKEAVQIPIRSSGDRVEWRIEDFFGTEVGRGSVPVAGQRALLEPKSGMSGYFEVHLAAKENDETIAEGAAAYAVVPPVDPAPTDESPFGIMTHFAQGWDRDLIPLIARAGIRHIRDELYWKRVEPVLGSYVFPASYDAYMNEALSHGLEPLIVLSFGNELYDEGLTPYTDAGRDGYARYGEAILDQYDGHVRALEIWNEYNGKFAEGPATEDRPAYYMRMLKQSYERIKSIQPEVKVLGGAAVKIPLPYLESIFAQGGLDYMDGVVIHPYRGKPEGVERELAALKDLIRQYHDGATKPIWVTEFGRHDDSTRGRHKTAAYLVRMATLLLSEDVERMYWYLMRDYRSFESMGLVRDEDSPLGRYAPAPAYVAYANLIRQLSEARYVRREPSDPRTHVHVFERAGEEIRVSWSTAPFARVHFRTRAPLTVVDIVGREQVVAPTDDTISLMLAQNPIYVKGPVLDVREQRSELILAWAEQDFEDLQGARSWHYGHYDGDGEGEGDGIGPTGPYTDDDFERLAPTEDAWGWRWGDPGLGPVSIDGNGAHPSAIDDRPVWAVRRWVSDIRGTVDVAGTIERGRKGDGTAARILIDGVEIFAADVGGPDHPKTIEYAFSAPVQPGSTVDFAVTPGAATDFNFDGTRFTALITVPLLAASELDFAPVQGAEGWQYGHYDGDAEGEGDGLDPVGPYTDDDFEHLTLIEGADTWHWGDAGLRWLRIGRGRSHPSVADDRSVWAVRRWESSIAGPVRISGTISGQPRGDATRALILVDGEEIYATDVGGSDHQATVQYAVSTVLEAGSILDFAVTPGPASNTAYDSTTFTAEIADLR